MSDITKPLILWQGTHEAGSGKGCAMNVISWENGDKTITDFPECSDTLLSLLVQDMNDVAAEADGSLSPENSMTVLGLGHQTVGTAYHDLSELDLQRVYVRVAAVTARSVEGFYDEPELSAMLALAERWAEYPTDENGYAVSRIANGAAKLAANTIGNSPVTLPVTAASWSASRVVDAAAKAYWGVTSKTINASDVIRAVHYAIDNAILSCVLDTTGVSEKHTQDALDIRARITGDAISLFRELTKTDTTVLPVSAEKALLMMGVTAQS